MQRRAAAGAGAASPDHSGLWQRGNIDNRSHFGSRLIYCFLAHRLYGIQRFTFYLHAYEHLLYFILIGTSCSLHIHAIKTFRKDELLDNQLIWLHMY